MKFENLVGLLVTDQNQYNQYRAAMKPILHKMGGEFGYDFSVGQVLKSETDHDINRVFTIRFPDQSVAQAFFANTDYLAIRDEYFEPSVNGVTIIAQYNID